MTPEQIEKVRAMATRLRELSKAVTNMPESRNEFSMRVPAEPERDADLVLASAADWIESRLAAGEPVAWVIPGDDNERDGGWLDARIDRDGEFTKPLYAAPPAQPPAAQVPDGDETKRLLDMIGQLCDSISPMLLAPKEFGKLITIEGAKSFESSASLEYRPKDMKQMRETFDRAVAMLATHKDQP